MDLRKGLVGHWTMDDADTSGGVLYDSSAYDRHGNIVGTLSTGVSSLIGQGYSFDGTEDEYVEYDTSSVNWSTEHTLCGWIYVDSSATYGPGSFGGAIVADGTFGSALYSDGTSPNVKFYVKPDDNSSGSTIISGNVNYDEWSHVAGVRDSSNTARIYVNGVEQASNQIDGTNAITSNTFYSGDDFGNGGADALEGDLSDIRIYNRALSNDEISALYNMRSQRQIESDLQKGLVGHWTMDSADTSGGTIYDKSAYDNDGETRSGVTTGADGIVGKCFSFDGTDGAYVPTRLFYDSTGIPAVSVAHWYKSSSSSDQITVSSDRNEYWRLGVGSDGKDGVLWTVDSSDMVSSTSRSSLQDGNWHHIVGTFDGSLTNDHAIYIDGELDSEANLRNSFGSGNTSYTHIGVGSEASVFDGGEGPNDHVVGEMDDVRVYNRGLSEREVKVLYNKR